MIAVEEEKHLRKKVLFLDPRMILHAVRSIVSNRPCPQIRGLPDDVEFLSMWMDHPRASFALVLCSSEWPVYKEGKFMDEVDGEIIYPPTEPDQCVLWRQLRHRLFQKDKALPAEEAIDFVTSDEWKNGSRRLEDS